MNDKQIEALLKAHGIRLTANRILIARTLSGLDNPASIKELEAKIQTIDKSNIFRTLSLFKQQHLVHQLEDGNDHSRATNYVSAMTMKKMKTCTYTSIVSVAIAPIASMTYTFHRSSCLQDTNNHPSII